MSLIGEAICYSVSYALLSRNSPGRYRNLSRISEHTEDFDHWRDETLRKCLESFPPSRFAGKAVMDFGCGSGQLSLLLRELGAQKVYGIDLNPECIDRARETNPYGLSVQYVIGAARSIPLPPGSVDVIYCIGVLEHVLEVDAILEEWWRVLRPGGQVLIHWSAWHHPDGSHLDSVLPIPYAQCIFSERTLARTAARIKLSAIYKPKFWDNDPKTGLRKEVHIQDEYTGNFLNKMSIGNFNKKLHRTGLFQIAHYCCHPPDRFSFIASLMKVSFFREHLTSFVTYVLTKPTEKSSAVKLNRPRQPTH